jgi:Skp family chaperone for outer membrane proteins
MHPVCRTHVGRLTRKWLNGPSHSHRLVPWEQLLRNGTSNPTSRRGNPRNTPSKGVQTVRVWSLLTTFVLGNLLTATLAVAQQPAAAGAASAASPTRSPIALVDVGFVLKNHPTMKMEIERIEADMKKADEEFASKRDAIIKQMEHLREQFTEGTPDYERQEKLIAEGDTNFRLELVKKRKEFDEARAGVIFKIYSDINTLVKYYCDSTGTNVVLRVTRETMDPKKPETVQMVMAQEVLYFQPSADITDWILQGLNQRATAAGGQTNTAARPNGNAPVRK